MLAGETKKQPPAEKQVKKVLRSEKIAEKNGNIGDSSPNDNNNIKQEERIISDFKKHRKFCQISFNFDLVSVILFFCALFTRIYHLDQPRNIVFDELHYGKYISLYLKNTFFFDVHPPLGKQLIAAVAYLTGYNGKFKFDKIGSPYTEDVPLMALRLVPALFGSLVIPTAYHLLLELKLSQWTAILGALLLLLDNALLTQSRFILMEPLLLFFSLFGIYCTVKFQNNSRNNGFLNNLGWLLLGSASLACGLAVKYVGFYSCCLAGAILFIEFWGKLANPKFSDLALLKEFIVQFSLMAIVPVIVYMGIFYIHLDVLYKAGPHDSIMTSAFQASLEGGLASITRGQPLLISHGSQITLRHTHGRTCWLHSHQHVYPVRYSDNRGSSHQQQVSCYSFKDVNNWWIVKRPDKNELVVEQPVDVIKHGDVIQLVHGITSRALNSHDVAAPLSPQFQEVSCYIDYNVSMAAQNLWRVEITNRDQGSDTWNAIHSMVRLIHVDTSQALKFSGKQLPDWGFHQHEVVTDRIIVQDDTVWNVEEHRYTKSDDQKERERELVNAEMIPTAVTSLSFWEKFYELHYKMMFSNGDGVQNHMYSSEPLEWPFMSRGIAYYVSQKSNAQIHLLGNIVIWYSATFALLLYLCLFLFYLLRRRRQCYDLQPQMWEDFQTIGKLFVVGYFFHYIPYFFVERTLFLQHYLPAFSFKVLLAAALLEHIYLLALNSKVFPQVLSKVFIIGVLLWLVFIFYVFRKFSVLSYGLTDLSTEEIFKLRWKDTWDFIVHKN